MNLFLDTSALVKLYHEEKGSSNLKNFLNKSGNDLTLTISQISIIEFHSAFMRRVFMNEIDLRTAKSILNLFKTDFIFIQYNFF